MQYVMFAKHLQEWPLARAAAVVAGMGFGGLDLTVRAGGYVLPENVAKDLPKAVATCAGAGLSVPMITTNLVRADADHGQATIEAAAACGIREIKYGYHTYRGYGEFMALIDQARADLADAAATAQRCGVRLNLHIHSGNFVTANPAVVAQLLADHDPATVGAYIDPGHMVIEGGVDVWRQGLEMLAERTVLMAVKSMAWLHRPDDGRTGRYVNKMVPLTRGMVDWVAVWRCLLASGFDGVVSLHGEYQGGHSWRDLTVDEVVDQTREDFAYVRACREKAETL
ncbi:MAG: sugar phosphate isomerase/epimerase [Armatimonadetes bacterium]|nr:sugar phosphate isomerase/epimerase [Armatimonadota bacterium]